MNGKRIGYIRVSSIDQNADRQLEGVKLDKIFTDKTSGGSLNRPQLAAMMEFIREGDTVVAHSMDRLARNLSDLRNIVKKLTDQGIRVEFIKENLIFTGEDSSMSILMLNIVGAVAEFERSLIKERQREGIELAKKKGVYKGRKRALTASQINDLKAEVLAGGNKTALAGKYGISRETLYQYLKK
ncbi:recombinase family protein [Legionella septentrionalis]|uniref:recombinase family protein n=1 Tax=Legionella septentrionalis TaxID=2498109 RepID=UPI000F8F6B10|nr:recombinase family protein [Legionella septentrionalis]RUQ92925.1 recombinase family protein [Legionella septentrionalis]